MPADASTVLAPAPSDPARRATLLRLGRAAAGAAGGLLPALTRGAADSRDGATPSAPAATTAPAITAGREGSRASPRPVASTFASGLSQPWGLAFLPDGRMLVTQKRGALVIVSADGREVGPPVANVPRVHAAGQGGLLDVVLDPDFAAEPWVYLSYSEPGSGAEAGTSGTAVARGRLVGNRLEEVAVIFRQAPKTSGNGHYGSRLVFRADKTLWVSLGERMLGAPAQDLSTHLGKIVRIRRDGGVPAGNPALGPDARPEIWSYGHRNPQGMAAHPQTGELWLHEHGPMGGDEINIARAGGNHGWPLRSYGCPYGSAGGSSCWIGSGRHAPTYVEPLTTWGPTSIAPSGAAFYTGALFPEWQGNLFLGALADRALWRVTLQGDAVVAREPLFASLGERMRDVRQGPDGALYVVCDGREGRILRIAR